MIYEMIILSQWYTQFVLVQLYLGDGDLPGIYYKFSEIPPTLVFCQKCPKIVSTFSEGRTFGRRNSIKITTFSIHSLLQHISKN